jgi:hypothetical protein
MKMRRYTHNENPMDVIRAMISRGDPVAPQEAAELLDVRMLPVIQESVASVLLESIGGKKASAVTSECSVCGTKAASKVEIPRHAKDPITRCPECGKHNGPGANTVRGSTNYTGSPGSFYDEGL